jgi:nucleotide-binding universal stress UspA family protein/MFS family permease
MRRGPLAGVYPAAAAMVAFALIPFLALSAALGPITPIIARQVHLSSQAMSLTFGMANAGYAVGTVLAVLFAQHLPQRRMTVLYAALLLAGSVLAAAATAPAPFIVGHVLQGLCTSLLLIAAIPPLVLGQPVSKMRWTAMIIDMVVFGAIAVGPLLGGAEASAHASRPLFWVIAGVAGAALLLALATFEDAPPADRTAPRDISLVALATGGCAAAFYGASELTTHPFINWVTVAPLIGGLALIVILILYQYRAKNPILNIRGLTTTIPIAGIVAAVCAAAASVSAVTLVSIELSHRFSPIHAGFYLLPEFAGAAVTAVLLGLLLRRRGVHYLVLGGMVSLSAGIIVIGRLIPASEALTLIGSALIGLGVGASVAPALFLTGFSVAASNLQRVFALIELLRGVAAFMVAPILVHFARRAGGGPVSGTSIALWICFGLSTGGLLIAMALYWLGGVRPEAPRMEEWFSSQRPGVLGGPVPALDSPPLLAAIRSRSVKRAQEQLLLNERHEESPNNGDDAQPRTASYGAMDSRRPDDVGAVLFAYDGSDIAGSAIAEAGRQLTWARDALVLTTWEPFNVEFLPINGTQLDASDSSAVSDAAVKVAEQGAALAREAGFRAQSITTRSTPSWTGIVDVADDRGATLVVLGSHGRTSLPTVILGSVANAVARHSARSVLIVHRRRDHVDEFSEVGS